MLIQYLHIRSIAYNAKRICVSIVNVLLFELGPINLTIYDEMMVNHNTTQNDTS
jgi:hypothetical protein